MSTYELFYFDSRGRAEVARLIFVQAGVKYQDTRFKDREDWLNNYKKKSPFGVAPWLEVDGKPIGGGREIARYLGEEFGLAGSNSLENAQLSAIADMCDDMMMVAAKPFETRDDPETAAKLSKEFVEKSPKWLDPLENRISASGWLFGDKMTWADLHVYHLISLVIELGKYAELLNNYPKLSAMFKKVESQPNIAKWIKERPVTST